MLRKLLIILLMIPTLLALDKLGDSGRRKVLRDLGLEELKRTFIRIPINLLFLGFHRESLGKFQLTHKSLRTWFEHVEDHVAYTVVDSATGRVVRTSDSVFYDFQIRVIEVDKLVDAAVEAALKTFMRRETMTNTTFYQVDADRMGAVVESLLHAMGLGDSYTFIVANPDVSFLSSGKPYGYRTGFSSDEITFLHQQYKESKLKLTLPDKENDTSPEDHDPDHEAEPITKHDRKPASSIEFMDKKKISEKWASNFLIQNRELIKQREASLKISDEQCDKPETIVLKDELDRTLQKSESKHETKHGHARGHRINMELMKNASVLSRHIVRSGSEEDRKYLQQVVELGPDVIHANCLVDAWIGRGRYAWVDLSAGPFMWGPKHATIADQVRGIYSFPRVTIPQEDTVDHGESLQSESLNKLQKMISASDGEDELEVLLVSWERYCRYYDLQDNKQKPKSKGSDGHFEPVICKYLAKRLKALNDSVTEDETFDIQQLAIGGVDPDITQMTDVDGFLSHLGFVISNGIRQIIAPPLVTSDQPHRKFSPNVERVMVYVLYNHEAYDPLGTNTGGLDSNLLKHEINKFRTTEKPIEVSVWPLPLSSHPVLAYAFAYAQKAVTIHQGDTLSTVNYIDSSLLEDELHRWLEADSMHSSSVKTSTINIIIISVSRDQPLLIDKIYQAVPLSDMVLAIQNSQTKWNSHMTCNGNPIKQNLRNPSKSLLLAIVMKMSGVGPLHISHPDGGDRVNNWLWSVGDSPLSDTSTAAHFSGIQRDLVHRNAIASAIEDTLDTLQVSIDVLASLPNTSVLSRNFMWSYISLGYPKIVKKIHIAATKASHLAWYSALQSVENATMMAEAFLLACQSVADRAKTTACQNEEGFFDAVRRLAISQWPAIILWSVPFSLIFSAVLWWIRSYARQRIVRGLSVLPQHNKRL